MGGFSSSGCSMVCIRVQRTGVAGESGRGRAVGDGRGGGGGPPDVSVADERPGGVRVVTAHDHAVGGDRLQPRPRRYRRRPAAEHYNNNDNNNNAVHSLLRRDAFNCSRTGRTRCSTLMRCYALFNLLSWLCYFFSVAVSPLGLFK